MIDETKNSELQSTSMLKLDRNNSLENERCISDYSSLHIRVLALAFKIEEMMDDIIKVLIVDDYQYLQMENVERQ